MISLDAVKKIIPQEALEHSKKIFTQSQFDQFLISFRNKRFSSFRINTLKYTKHEIIKDMQNSGFKFKPVDIIDNAFIFEGSSNILLKSELVKEGKIYLQSIASMIPPLILSPQEGETILDIAASPGSKTTQISSLMKNTGIIDAIEPDYIRMERLMYNARLLGAINIKFHKTDGKEFYKIKNKVYDRVLADVPCSGEGRFSFFDKISYGKWRKSNINKFSNLQKKLLKSAILAAKIGGIIVYSTCTLNIYENEQVIDSILMDNDYKIEILAIPENFKNIKESINPIMSFEQKKFDQSINKSLRIIPSQKLEGFFICKMKRIK